MLEGFENKERKGGKTRGKNMDVSVEVPDACANPTSASQMVGRNMQETLPIPNQGFHDIVQALTPPKPRQHCQIKVHSRRQDPIT